MVSVQRKDLAQCNQSRSSHIPFCRMLLLSGLLSVFSTGALAETKLAVIKFQQANGIKSDPAGVVGPATRAKLTELADAKNIYY